MQLNSVWGSWWEPIRKWFYPVWLGYETSYRFYDYALATYQYSFEQSGHFLASIGSLAADMLALFCSVITFLVCSIFLTVPACYVLYQFFNTENLTGTVLERKGKVYF